MQCPLVQTNCYLASFLFLWWRLKCSPYAFSKLPLPVRMMRRGHRICTCLQSTSLQQVNPTNLRSLTQELRFKCLTHIAWNENIEDLVLVQSLRTITRIGSNQASAPNKALFLLQQFLIKIPRKTVDAFKIAKKKASQRRQWPLTHLRFVSEWWDFDHEYSTLNGGPRR